MQFSRANNKVIAWQGHWAIWSSSTNTSCTLRSCWSQYQSVTTSHRGPCCSKDKSESPWLQLWVLCKAGWKQLFQIRVSTCVNSAKCITIWKHKETPSWTAVINPLVSPGLWSQQNSVTAGLMPTLCASFTSEFRWLSSNDLTEVRGTRICKACRTHAVLLDKFAFMFSFICSD